VGDELDGGDKERPRPKISVPIDLRRSLSSGESCDRGVDMRNALIEWLLGMNLSGDILVFILDFDLSGVL